MTITTTTPPQSRRPRASGRRPAGEPFASIGPLLDAVPFHGPPLVFLFVPWLLLGLLLAPPVAVLATFVVLMVVTAAVLALAVAILAAPVVLVRHLHRHLHLNLHRAAPAPVSAPSTALLRAEPQHLTA
jgi:hypothetical protein